MMGKHWKPGILDVARDLKYNPETGHLHGVTTVEKPTTDLMRWMVENKHPLKQWRKFASFSDIVRAEEVNPEPAGKPCKRTGALIIYRGNQQFYAHVIAWLKIYGEPPVDGIAHLNGNRADNRADNLASVLEVARMRAKPYRARIRDDGRLVHLGYFATAEERDAAIFAYRIGLRNVPQLCYTGHVNNTLEP